LTIEQPDPPRIGTLPLEAGKPLLARPFTSATLAAPTLVARMPAARMPVARMLAAWMPEYKWKRWRHRAL
jgi:hypothetical protein